MTVVLEFGKLYRFSKDYPLYIGEKKNAGAQPRFKMIAMGTVLSGDVIMLIEKSRFFNNAFKVIHEDQVGWIFAELQHFTRLEE